MADDQVTYIDTSDGSRVFQKAVDIGSDLHALAVSPAGADWTIGTQKVEQRFAHSGLKTATATIKSGAGFLHALQFSQNDAAPTAGTIDVYDGVDTNGTKLFSWTMTTAVFIPFSVIFDVAFATGLHVVITTTADVNVSASYR